MAYGHLGTSRAHRCPVSVNGLYRAPVFTTHPSGVLPNNHFGAGPNRAMSISSLGAVVTLVDRHIVKARRCRCRSAAWRRGRSWRRSWCGASSRSRDHTTGPIQTYPALLTFIIDRNFVIRGGSSEVTVLEQSPD